MQFKNIFGKISRGGKKRNHRKLETVAKVLSRLEPSVAGLQAETLCLSCRSVSVTGKGGESGVSGCHKLR